MIVMRDKLTQRGRGFGFVKMTLKDEEEAKIVKEALIAQNNYPGHFILDKKVDVKSADDYQGKGMMGGGGGPSSNPMGQFDFNFPSMMLKQQQPGGMGFPGQFPGAD